VTHSIVRFSFVRIFQGFVGRLQGGKLGLRARVVVEVGMVFPDLLPERAFDVLLGGVGGESEQIVEILRHG
jgi:hypothetical protein